MDQRRRRKHIWPVKLVRESTVRALLAEVEATQDALLDLVRAVLTPRRGRVEFQRLK